MSGEMNLGALMPPRYYATFLLNAAEDPAALENVKRNVACLGESTQLAVLRMVGGDTWAPPSLRAWAMSRARDLFPGVWARTWSMHMRRYADSIGVRPTQVSLAEYSRHLDKRRAEWRQATGRDDWHPDIMERLKAVSDFRAWLDAQEVP